MHSRLSYRLTHTWLEVAMTVQMYVLEQGCRQVTQGKEDWSEQHTDQVAL